MATLTSNPQSLGKITVTAGTPISLTSNFSSFSSNPPQDSDLWAYEIQVRANGGGGAITSNTSNVYIGRSNMVKATLVGVMEILGPGESRIFKSAAMNTLYPGGIYVDGDTTGDWIVASASVL